MDFFLKSPPLFTGEEQQLGRAVMLLNQQVDHLLKLQKKEIQRDIQEINKKKRSSNKCTNPYESLSADGMFYDKRNWFTQPFGIQTVFMLIIFKFSVNNIGLIFSL